MGHTFLRLAVLLNGLMFVLVRAASSQAPSGTAPSGSKPSGSAPGGSSSGGSPGGSSSGSSSAMYLTGAYTCDDTTVTNSSITVTSTTADQNAFLVTNDGRATVSNSKIDKAGGDTSDEDDSSFFGLDSAVCAQNASSLYLYSSVVTSNATGANAIYSTGSGSYIYVKDVNITTHQSGSRGLDATQLGIIVAENVRITTSGAHCGGLANDRGGGIILASKAIIATSGQGSPGIYCTGNITGHSITAKAAGSQAIVVEGINNVTLTDSKMEGYVDAGAMLYQSESGDAADGSAILSMTRGSLAINTTTKSSYTLTNATGAIFYVTNQNAYIYLYDNVALSSSSGILAKGGASSWGTSGSNSGNIFLSANGVSLPGSIEADSISAISVSLVNSSSFSGYVPNKGGKVGISLDATSSWTVTGNSFLWNFTDVTSSFNNIEDNGFYIYYNTSSATNSWLNATSYTLKNGGKLTPWTAASAVNSTTSSTTVTAISGATTVATPTSTAATKSTSAASSANMQFIVPAFIGMRGWAGMLSLISVTLCYR